MSGVGGDGDDYTFELSISSPSFGGSLAPGLNVGTRIKDTIQFTFTRDRELFYSTTPPVCQVLRQAQ